MITYYTYVIIITLMALGVFSILVYENNRISMRKKRLFILTNLFVAIAAAAECAGVHISGNTEIPRWVLSTVKAIDYTFTPMTGGAMLALMRKSEKKWSFWGIFAANGVLQALSARFGWMVVIDEQNNYAHGILYPVYIVFYSYVILLYTGRMLSYGKRFRKQNRKSLYGSILLVFLGAAMQEFLGGDCRVAYLATAFGVTFLFIHYSEFSQLEQDDAIADKQYRIENDVLTSARSRFAYLEVLKEYEKTLPQNLAVFMVDVNGLKAVNDSLGHEAGDELLCGAADCLQATIGKAGSLYRIGGDEFVVFAFLNREKIRAVLEDLEKMTSLWVGRKCSSLSLSVGFALTQDHPGIAVEQLVKLADEGMYEQKRKYYQELGRDRRKGREPRG